MGRMRVLNQIRDARGSSPEKSSALRKKGLAVRICCRAETAVERALIVSVSFQDGILPDAAHGYRLLAGGTIAMLQG